jgi:hypothetical protein
MSYDSKLYAWCAMRLQDARIEGAIDKDTTDAVIHREAQRMESEIHQLASSFIDNTFNGDN